MKDLKPALLLFLAFTVICGGLYPALVTAVGQLCFPGPANGSLLRDGTGRLVGSRLIGQPFSEAKHFWPRPSATGDFSYNPMASGGSNSGPTNPAYLQSVSERVKALREAGITGEIPAELVQASASGLDPHLSPEAVRVQIPRVAKARGIGEERLASLMAGLVEAPQFGILGAERVNVVELNLALDGLK